VISGVVEIEKNFASTKHDPDAKPPTPMQFDGHGANQRGPSTAEVREQKSLTSVFCRRSVMTASTALPKGDNPEWMGFCWPM
jgi:hypothetical protein